MHILIVEDDTSIAEMLAECLADEGHETMHARHGQEALHYLQSHAQPQLIILDASMPVMNGWEFLEQRDQLPQFADIPVIMLTAIRGSDYRQTQWPNVQRVAKPVDIYTLLSLVATYQPD